MNLKVSKDSSCKLEICSGNKCLPDDISLIIVRFLGIKQHHNEWYIDSEQCFTLIFTIGVTCRYNMDYLLDVIIEKKLDDLYLKLEEQEEYERDILYQMYNN